MAPPQPKTNAAFADWAKKTARGRSLRELSREIGISHTRISDMQFGVVPSFRLLERYCEALQLPADERGEGFRLADYDPDIDTRSGADLLLDYLRDLQSRRPDSTVHIPRFHGGARSLTTEEAEALIAELREQFDDPA